jgi:hypothetical protein
MADSEWITLEEAAAHLRKTPRQINEYCKDGKLEFHKMAGETYISDESIGLFLELYEGRRRMPSYEDEKEKQAPIAPPEKVEDVNVAEDVQSKAPEPEVKLPEPEVKVPEPEVKLPAVKPIIEEKIEEGARFSTGSPKPAPATPGPDVKPISPIPMEQGQKEPQSQLRKYGEPLETPKSKAPSASNVESLSWKPSEAIIPPIPKTEPTEPPKPSIPITPAAERSPEPPKNVVSSPPPPSLYRNDSSDQPGKVEPSTPKSTTPFTQGYHQTSQPLNDSEPPKPATDTNIRLARVPSAQATKPATINQEGVGKVNNTTPSRSSELLKSIRDRIVTHEASEQAFCEELRGLVDRLESAFKEEESKAGQLTQEISSLISRYSQAGQ